MSRSAEGWSERLAALMLADPEHCRELIRLINERLREARKNRDTESR